MKSIWTWILILGVLIIIALILPSIFKLVFNLGIITLVIVTGLIIWKIAKLFNSIKK